MYSLKTETYEEGRDAVLLKLDEEDIRSHFAYWNNGIDDLPSGKLEFWKLVHQARTLLGSLPPQARMESKKWLRARGFRSLDRGEV